MAAPKKPPAILIQRERKMTPAKLKETFVQLAPHQVEAFETLVDEMLLSAINDVADPRTVQDHPRMAQQAGWIDCLANLKSRFAELRGQ